MTRQPQTRAVSQLYQWSPRTAFAVLPVIAGLGGLAYAAGGVTSVSDDIPEDKKAPVDEFHPKKDLAVEKAYGGEVVVHLSTMVEGLNQAIENSAVARWIRYEVHDQLVLQNWESWEYEPSLAEGVDSEDQLILKPASAAKYPGAKVVGSGDKARHIIYGKVEASGSTYTVTGVSKGTMLGKGKQMTVSADDVDSLEQGTVFTYYLPDNCDWHDGHRFNSDDVLFSWEIYSNMTVDADETRFQYEQILAGEAVDPTTIRFVFEKQYFKALDVPGSMCILPRHLYDLNDPDNKKFDPDTHAEFAKLHGADHVFTEAELGTYVNENPHNTAWVGLGPYKIVSWDDRTIVAERFDGYFKPDESGYVDKIVWRHISDDNTAFNSLVNGELDYFARVKSEDFFGEATKTKAFTDTFYSGYFYTGSYGYTGMNMYRPTLKDIEVRKALTMAFDWEEFKATQYKDLAMRVNGPQNLWGPAYNNDVDYLPYDPDTAEELLAEAGWYDRDGDGVIDKDGIKLELDFLYPSGNAASISFGLKMQQSYAPLGIKINMSNFEWSTFLERMLERNFDLVNLAWVPPIESDPEQLWHSKWGEKDKKSSNMCGVMDEELDALIEKGQKELDLETRSNIWKAIHKRIYEDIHPYMFGFNSPRKFAMNKKVRGFQTFKIAPGYSLRRWYYPAGTAGTRANMAK